VLEKLATTTGQAKILVFNKIDQLKDRAELLKKTHDLTGRCSFDAVVYLSAKTGAGLDDLMGEVFARLPEGELIYPADEFTDRPIRFLVAELVREQLMLQLHQEIPYGLTVVTERFEEKPNRVHIHALIVVSEERHKGMVIGKKGEVLKRVGTRARYHIENLLGQPVHLELHVKAQAGWMEDERTLDQLGYAQ
jgi:GTP-binding protein Era